MDFISALPDETLLLVLARLRCICTAVQTSLLSRRWIGLWIGLWIGPTDLIFRGLAPCTIQALFLRFGASPQVATLDIDLPRTNATTSANSLLRAAVRLSPVHLVFTLEPYNNYIVNIDLPCFERTSSIELNTQHFWVSPPTAGEFTALESLSVAGITNDLGSLLNRCPRLRVLSVTYPDQYTLHIRLPPDRQFPTLEKLSLSGKILDPGTLLYTCQGLRELSVTQWDTSRLHIWLPPSGEFPMLKKLSLSGNIADLGTWLTRCPRLRVLGLTFRGMVLGSLEAELMTLEEAAPPGLVLSLLSIRVPWKDGVDAAPFSSLLRTTARPSPQEVVFTDNFEGHNSKQINADLPCFPGATSIEMSLQNVCFTPLLAGKFSMLERLFISGRSGIVDIGTLVTNCPCLRVLEVTVAAGEITVHSASLQKLVVLPRDGYTECHGIDIVTPALKQLHMDVHAGRGIPVSISAPAVEKLTWRRWYTVGWALVFGSWLMQSMIVQAIENRDVTCWQVPRLRHVLCLHLNAGNHLDGELNFAKEMEKLPVANFSVLELKFKEAWHVYGALVLQLLRMCRIRAATKKLKVVLPWWPKAKRACARNCACNRPKNWRIQSIFCTSLEEVEILGFNGEDHEHDFLRLIFKCSPMLKSMIVRPSETSEDRTTELSNIFLAHPSVNCHQ